MEHKNEDKMNKDSIYETDEFGEIDSNMIATIESDFLSWKAKNKADSEQQRQDQESGAPFERYRNGVFSCTDMTTPIWCEIQYFEGLKLGRVRETEGKVDIFFIIFDYREPIY